MKIAIILRIAAITAIFAGLAPIGLLAATASTTQKTKSPATTPRLYAGDDTCRRCHAEESDNFHRTAHFLTSQLPDRHSVLGSFTTGDNLLKTSNDELSFRMDARPTGLYQTAIQGTAPDTIARSERFGLVIGSGEKGQTYAYWKGDQLFQLPVSYWNQVGWVNSPGYPDGFANFDRPIVPRCLECHGTYFSSLQDPPNRYRKSGFVVGITCEKCHGPGREHVQRLTSNKKATDLTIINPAKFSRDRSMDLCAWCHTGKGVSLKPAFSYSPGEPLENYLELPPPDADAPLDVHGSQVELLKKSRCYQASRMTCTTCHNVHTPQRDPVAFSKHCTTCHQPQACGLFRIQGHAIDDRCVTCHMPRQDTNLIVFDWKGKRVRPQMVNHWIKVYPAAQTSN